MSRTSQIDVKSYRKIDRLSYSGLSLFLKDKIKFKKQYVDKQENSFKSTDFSRMGNICDVYLTDPDNFDEYFVITYANKPSGQMLTFVDFLLELYKNKTNEEMTDLMLSAYELLKESNGGKLQKSFEKFIENFVKDGEAYFQENIQAAGKEVITLEEAALAEKIVERINNSKSFESYKGFKKIVKHPILFTLGDWDMKAEIDEMLIDEKNKIIYPFDYKIVSFVESFFWDCFIKNKYYIQSSLYKFAIEQWKLNTEYKDYRVENFSFKVADQINYMEPLLYKTGDEYYERGFLGFYIGNKHYKGINEILDEIKFSMENEVWDISLTNYKNNGIVLLPKLQDKIND